MRKRLALLAGMLVVVALAAPTTATAGKSFADTIQLPNGWLPEGVAIGNGPVIYSGSRANGAIYAADLHAGNGNIVVPGASGRVSVGLSFDKRSGLLFAAGGPTGKAYVFDPVAGVLVQEYTLTAPGTFVNDVIVTGDAAYFTQSSLAEYYRVPLGKRGQLPAQGAVQTIPLSGDWQQVAGFNSNGIEATKNGKDLIIVNSASGHLYHVVPGTGVATLIDLGGASVSSGDGLLLKGRTLYVVRNQLNQISVFKLRHDLLSGVQIQTITDPRFDVPTTIARFGKALYAVNARFTTPPTPDTTYTIVRVEP